MVATKKQVAGMREGGREGVLDEADLHGQLLQFAQRAFRLVQVVDLLLYGSFHPQVGDGYVEGSH